MKKRNMIGAALIASMFWGSAASACLPPPPEAPVPREADESDADYQARVARLRAEAQAARQAEAEAFAPIRENNLWDHGIVTRIAVVDVVGVADPGDGPPSMTVDFLFSTVQPERGMERDERFALTENRHWTNPCIPVVSYPVGARYVLFASDGPISRSLPLFLLLPAAEVRSERGLALLRAAEQAAR